MILEQLVLEPDVIIIGVEFSINVIIGFLKQNRNGLRLKRYLEPTQTRWRFFQNNFSYVLQLKML